MDEVMKKLYSKALLESVQKASEDKPEVFRFRATTGVIDRQGEIVTADGWDTDNFMKNPVFLLSHDYYSPPIGKVVSITNDGEGLLADVVFDMDDPDAAKIANKFKRGFLSAVSVGFKSNERTGSWSDPQNPVKHLKKELLEISAVSVPANPEALLARSLADRVTKAGRTLSQKNQSLIQSAVDALNSVLESLGMQEDEDDKGKAQGSPEPKEFNLDISKLLAYIGQEKENQNG